MLQTVSSHYLTKIPHGKKNSLVYFSSDVEDTGTLDTKLRRRAEAFLEAELSGMMMSQQDHPRLGTQGSTCRDTTLIRNSFV